VRNGAGFGLPPATFAALCGSDGADVSPPPSYSNNCKGVDEKMAICDKCKKTPLEYREINPAYQKGREVILCDECYEKVLREYLQRK
jgi:hypothetical protein